VTSEEGCAKFGVELCETLEELCEKSDCLLIRAPSDPEKHLQYAKTALTYGKPTYIDKTFAPTLAEAQEIFRIGEEHGTKLFSTSALRYAAELEKCGTPDSLLVTGGGSNLAEYLVHLVEIAVPLLNDPMVYARIEEVGEARQCYVETVSGKVATLTWAPPLPYTVWASTAGQSSVYTALKSDFFKGLMADILRFYESGEPPVAPAQTLEVMRVREALLRATECPGIWIE
jgi:predicted dehydrogenase